MVGEPRLQWAGVERPAGEGLPLGQQLLGGVTVLAEVKVIRAAQLRRARMASEREERKRDGVVGRKVKRGKAGRRR